MAGYRDKENIIKEAFPNARFFTSNNCLEPPSKTELVIIMANFCGHKLFYRAKTWCRQKGIPYVSCNSFSVKEIEDCIRIGGEVFRDESEVV